MVEDQVCGTIDHIVYADEENGFTVAYLNKRSREDKGLCIVGHFPKLHPGETIVCKGSWKHHPVHGRQFDVSSFELDLPKDILGIRRYLESGTIKGVGPVNAKRIVDAFGADTMKVIDEQPDRLNEVEGLGKKRIDLIVQHWQDQRSMRDVMIFLRAHGVGMALAKKIYRQYGDESVAIIQQDPFAIARDVFGIGFKTADKIAGELNIPMDAPMRVEAGIEYVLQELSEDGHVCYPEEELFGKAEKMLEVDRPALSTALISLENKNRIFRSELPVKEEHILHVWIKPLFFSERGIAKECARLISAPCAIREIKCDKALEWVQEKQRIRLAKEQEKALSTSLIEKMHIITGGPGTGKSTVTKAILSIHSKISDKILLAAPTGRAAKRLSDITYKRAFTIHSLLEMDFVNGGFKRNKENPLDCDLIIIDEASMIDTYLMSALLRAIPDRTRVILIGDIDQLPSVGPGNVLRDLIDSRRIPLTRLVQIFRQAKGSQIVINAHNINRGIFPELAPTDEKSDFIFIESNDPEEILQHILEMNMRTLPQTHGFNPLEEIQVLSPMRRGIIGIENLNIILQKHLNLHTEHVERFGRKFHLGDKVMQIRNNYSKAVSNGDVGIISHIDSEEMHLQVTFDQRLVDYEFTDLDELVLAYAVSIHKYQGSECPCIIIPIHTSHFKLLQRNLLYTALTRGKKLVVLIGSKQAIALAIQNDEVEKRHTGLSHFITEKL